MTRRSVATPSSTALCRLLLLLPVLLPAYDRVVSGSESPVAFSGCPPPFPVADNASRSPEWCDCTTFGEIYCHNLQAVPPFRHPPSAVPWRGVYMSRQRITRLGSGAFGNLRTAKLVLNFNRLGDAVEAGALAGQETSLAELQLAGCGITSLPGRLLAGMDSLTRLHLWGNKLREFPVRFFRAAANLRELMLWNNELAVLESDTLAGLWNLQRLDMDRNFISELHKDAFRNLIELQTLHIANNQIQVTETSPLNLLIIRCGLSQITLTTWCYQCSIVLPQRVIRGFFTLVSVGVDTTYVISFPANSSSSSQLNSLDLVRL